MAKSFWVYETASENAYTHPNACVDCIYVVWCSFNKQRGGGKYSIRNLLFRINYFCFKSLQIIIVRHTMTKWELTKWELTKWELTKWELTKWEDTYAYSYYCIYMIKFISQAERENVNS